MATAFEAPTTMENDGTGDDSRAGDTEMLYRVKFTRTTRDSRLFETSDEKGYKTFSDLVKTQLPPGDGVEEFEVEIHDWTPFKLSFFTFMTYPCVEVPFHSGTFWKMEFPHLRQLIHEEPTETVFTVMQQGTELSSDDVEALTSLVEEETVLALQARYTALTDEKVKVRPELRNMVEQKHLPTMCLLVDNTARMYSDRRRMLKGLERVNHMDAAFHLKDVLDPPDYVEGDLRKVLDANAKKHNPTALFNVRKIATEQGKHLLSMYCRLHCGDMNLARLILKHEHARREDMSKAVNRETAASSSSLAMTREMRASTRGAVNYSDDVDVTLPDGSSGDDMSEYEDYDEDDDDDDDEIVSARRNRSRKPGVKRMRSEIEGHKTRGSQNPFEAYLKNATVRTTDQESGEEDVPGSVRFRFANTLTRTKKVPSIELLQNEMVPHDAWIIDGMRVTSHDEVIRIWTLDDLSPSDALFRGLPADPSTLKSDDDDSDDYSVDEMTTDDDETDAEDHEASPETPLSPTSSPRLSDDIAPPPHVSEEEELEEEFRDMGLEEIEDALEKSEAADSDLVAAMDGTDLLNDDDDIAAPLSAKVVAGPLNVTIGGIPLTFSLRSNATLEPYEAEHDALTELHVSRALGDGRRETNVIVLNAKRPQPAKKKASSTTRAARQPVAGNDAAVRRRASIFMQHGASSTEQSNPACLVRYRDVVTLVPMLLDDVTSTDGRTKKLVNCFQNKRFHELPDHVRSDFPAEMFKAERGSGSARVAPPERQRSGADYWVQFVPAQVGTRRPFPHRRHGQYEDALVANVIANYINRSPHRETLGAIKNFGRALIEALMPPAITADDVGKTLSLKLSDAGWQLIVDGTYRSFHLGSSIVPFDVDEAVIQSVQPYYNRDVVLKMGERANAILKNPFGDNVSMSTPSFDRITSSLLDYASSISGDAPEGNAADATSRPGLTRHNRPRGGDEGRAEGPFGLHPEAAEVMEEIRLINNAPSSVVTLPEGPVDTSMTTVADGVSHVEVATLGEHIGEEELDDLIGDWE